MDNKILELLDKIDEKEKKALMEIKNIYPKLTHKYSPDRNSYSISENHIEKLTLRGVSVPPIEKYLSQFANLKILNLHFNNLKSIPNIPNLVKLEELGLAANNIQCIENLSAYSSLQKLELGNNKIEIIENLSGNPTLESLNLSFNRISVIQNLEMLTKLQYLNLSGNKLTLISKIDKLEKLCELYLSKNQIRRISGLEQLKDLNLIDLEDNLIEIIENLEGCSKLSEFYIERNPLFPEYEDASKKSAQFWVNWCQIREDKVLSNIPILSFIGYSKSGKTASIESLIAFLTEAHYKVIALKHIHIDNFSIDTRGKNTWRYSQAGAKVVVAQSNQESGIIINWKLKPLHMIKTIYRIGLEDSTWVKSDKVIAVLEGFRDIHENQILCVRSYEELEKQMNSGIVAISGALFENEAVLNKIQREIDLPIVNIRDNPDQIGAVLKIDG